MNVLADNQEDKNIDANLFFKFLLSSGAPDDNKITKLDSECLNISSNVLLEYPEQFYSIFFQGFTNPDGNHFKVIINPNGMAAVVNNNNTYQDLAKVLREKSDIIPRAVVHFYNSYYSKGVYEWDIEYPKGLNPQDYKYNIDPMKALFEKVIGEK